jgi:hypothetical protein
MKFYVLWLVDWLPNAVRQTNQLLRPTWTLRLRADPPPPCYVQTDH